MTLSEDGYTLKWSRPIEEFIFTMGISKSQPKNYYLMLLIPITLIALISCYLLLCSTKISGFTDFLRIKGGANFKPTTSIHKKRVIMR